MRGGAHYNRPDKYEEMLFWPLALAGWRHDSEHSHVEHERVETCEAEKFFRQFWLDREHN